ncbi:hypothetical protein V1511DRAFT_444805, partial [Dipodascopsis uninucleata]
SKPIATPSSLRKSNVPLAVSFHTRPVPSSSFRSSSIPSVPVSPNLFPFSPPTGMGPFFDAESNVRVLRDRRRRGSSVVTTTILSPYDGDLIFSSSLGDHELAMLNEDHDEDMDDMDIDDMELDYHSDTDEEDWRSAGVESLRRGSVFHMRNEGKDALSSASSASSHTSYSSTADMSRPKTNSQLISTEAVEAKEMKIPLNKSEKTSFMSHVQINTHDREQDAVEALVQLRSL